MSLERDWKSDPITGELVFGEDGDIVFVSGSDAIRQDVEERLRLVRGEWFLDLDAGVPLFDDVLVKNPRLPVIVSAYRRAILETPGVVDVISISVNLDRRARTATIVFAADTDLGQIEGSTSANVGG